MEELKVIVISDKNNQNWGVFVHDDGFRRSLYTRPVEYEGVAPRETRILSFDGSFRLLVDTSGTLYTYPVNRKGLFMA